MKIGSADVYANHPTLVVGSPGDVADDLELNGAAAVGSDSQVLIATRGQAAPVKVSLWKEVGPRTGEVVFDHNLSLADQYVAVFDIERLTRFSATIGPSGRHRVLILVDDPGFASRIDVIFDSGPGRRALTAVPDLRLFDVSLPTDNELAVSDELALILSGHDIPMNRLAGAIKLIGISPVARPAIRSFWIRMVVEWIRWLSPGQSLAPSRELGVLIESRLPDGASNSIDLLAAEVASEVLRRSGLMR
jgi:hypothetical protein